MDKYEMNVLLKEGEHLINRYQLDNTRISINAEIPIIKAVDFAPTALIQENLAMANEPREGTVHYFLREYRINGVFQKIFDGMVTKEAPPWSWDGDPYRTKRLERYEEYLDKLRKFEAVCSPDYSIYATWGNPHNLLSVWKNRLVGQQFQKEGLIVIPTVSWSDPKTLEYAFLGLEPGGTYAVSATGCFDRNGNNRRIYTSYYRAGIDELVKRLDPIRIVVHGNKSLVDANYGNAEVAFFPSVSSIEANQRGKEKIAVSQEL